MISPLAEQLSNPQHCYIEVSPGVLFKHKHTYVLPGGEIEYNPLGGQPVRFTRLAAENMLKVLGEGAKIKEITCL